MKWKGHEAVHLQPETRNSWANQLEESDTLGESRVQFFRCGDALVIKFGDGTIMDCQIRRYRSPYDPDCQ